MKWGGRRGKALGRNESDATPCLKKEVHFGIASSLVFVARHVMQFKFFNMTSLNMLNVLCLFVRRHALGLRSKRFAISLVSLVIPLYCVAL